MLFAIQIESDNYKIVLFIEAQFDFHLPTLEYTEMFVCTNLLCSLVARKCDTNYDKL